MSTPLTVQFGNWVPDSANVPQPVTGRGISLPLADCNNVYFANSNYVSLPLPVAIGLALPGQCLGAFTAIDQAGKPQVYAGTQTHLYHWNGASWDQIDGGLQFFASSWSFAQFGNNVIAAFAPPQVQTLSSFWFGTVGTRFLTIPIGGSAFTYPTGAPSGSCVGVINQFAVAGNIWIPGPNTGSFVSLGTGNGITKTFSTTLANVPLAPFYVYAGAFPALGAITTAVDNGLGAFSTTGMSGTVNYSTGLISLTFTTAPVTGTAIQAYYLQAFPYRVQWSQIANQTSWPIPLTNAALAAQSGYEDLDPEFGGVMAIAGFPQFGIVLQRFGVSRMSYVGGSVVFSFAPFERKRGAISPHAAAAVGSSVYFVSDDGFYVTDGNSVIPIGTSEDDSVGVDGWFQDNVNEAAVSAISAGYDAATRSIYFAIPTGSNTAPDTLVLYNPLMRKWTKAAIATDLVWNDNSGSAHQLGVITQAHKYALLTGAPGLGYVETVDMFYPDGNVRTTTGVKPLIQSTDAPRARMGSRRDVNDAVAYTGDVARDSFSRICPLFSQGYLNRVRVSSSAAKSISGAMLYQEMGGPV